MPGDEEGLTLSGGPLANPSMVLRRRTFVSECRLGLPPWWSGTPVEGPVGEVSPTDWEAK